MTNNAGGLVGALATTASGSYSIASNNYYVNNIGIARTAAVGSASISTGNDTFANLLAKVRNFSSDTIYSGAWSTSTWQKSTQYNNGLPFFKTMTANTTTFPITVSFGANGGSGSLSSAYVFTNSMFITPANSFSAPSGKSFVGWTTISGGTDMEYAASSFVKGLTESTTLYAVWN